MKGDSDLVVDFSITTPILMNPHIKP